jgi:hypothetical protein
MTRLALAALVLTAAALLWRPRPVRTAEIDGCAPEGGVVHPWRRMAA